MDNSNLVQYPSMDSSSGISMNGSPSSPNHSDINLHDYFLMSDGSLYASDQESLSKPFSSKSESRRRPNRRKSSPRCPQLQLEQRSTANLRERQRYLDINDAFENLRAHIPILPFEKAMSKVDTLKLAIRYISFLGELVRANPCSTETGLSNIHIAEDQRKVVVGGSNSEAHSLSWSRRGEEKPSGSTFYAKIWMPEDPRIDDTIKKEEHR